MQYCRLHLPENAVFYMPIINSPFFLKKYLKLFLFFLEFFQCCLKIENDAIILSLWRKGLNL